MRAPDPPDDEATTPDDLRGVVRRWRAALSTRASLETLTRDEVEPYLRSRVDQVARAMQEADDAALPEAERSARYAAAVGLFLKPALTLMTLLLGRRDPITLVLVQTMGEVYEICGEYGRAEPLLERARAGWREHLEEAPRSAQGMQQLASTENSLAKVRARRSSPPPAR